VFPDKLSLSEILVVFDIERNLVKSKLEILLKMSLKEGQIDSFINEAENMKMSPLDAVKYLKSLKMNREELQKIIRSL